MSGRRRYTTESGAQIAPIVPVDWSRPKQVSRLSAPQTAREWHPTKNGNLRPDEVALNYSKRIWWQCKKGHEWQVSPNSRVKGTGCPFCNSVATSRLELRIYTELKSLFKDVRHREKIKRRELDVFLPELNLGIEIDGAYWHRDKDAKDLQKNHVFASAGVDVLRLREGDFASSRQTIFASILKSTYPLLSV